MFLKVGASHSKNVAVICFHESLVKMIKNAFYFILKALSVLNVFVFLSWLIGHVGMQLDKKAQINFKIFDDRGWGPIITIYILPNNSKK